MQTKNERIPPAQERKAGCWYVLASFGRVQTCVHAANSLAWCSPPVPFFWSPGQCSGVCSQNRICHRLLNQSKETSDLFILVKSFVLPIYVQGEKGTDTNHYPVNIFVSSTTHMVWMWGRDWNVTSSRESQSCTRLHLAQVPLALWVSTQVPFLLTFSREQPEAAWFLCCKIKIIKHRTSSLWILRAGWSVCKLCSFPLWGGKKSEEMHLIWAKKKKELLSTCYRVGSQSTRKQVRRQQDQGAMELHQAEVAPEAKQGYCSTGKFSLVSKEAGRQLSIPCPLVLWYFAQRKQLNLQLIS